MTDSESTQLSGLKDLAKRYAEGGYVSGSLRETAERDAERTRRTAHVNDATLWAFTATRLLRAAADRGEAWAADFVASVNRELSGCRTDTARLADFLYQEAEDLRPHMGETP